MTLMRWDPFRSMLSMKRDLDRMFGEYDDEGETAASLWRPAVDIFETKDNLVLRAELPGMKKEEVQISVENNVLTLKGERKFDKEIKRENYHRVERVYGNFCRSFTLPTSIDKNKIEATFRDGVLEVTMPRAEEAKPKQIDIKVK
jgi:HSP20 family protein